jgi:cytochrome P450
MARIPPLSTLPSFSRVTRAFAIPMGVPAGVPADLDGAVEQVVAWDGATRRLCQRYPRRSVFRRSVDMGVTVGDAIRLQRVVRTSRIDAWLATAPAPDAAAFETFRDAFFARCDAVAALSTEALVASSLAMPEDGLAAMLRQNPKRLGALIGPTARLASLQVVMAAVVLIAREWDFVSHFAARQLRRAGVPFSMRRAHATIARVNRLAGRTLITSRHTEALLAAYQELALRGVARNAADTSILAALEYGLAASGKPWKGLIRLTETLVYSGLSPTSPAWAAQFEAIVRAPINYTHVPGREWIVRDYVVGKTLMQLDGVIAPGDPRAGLQQGRSSLATGYLRGGHERIEFGRRYSKPLAAFLDSMVVAEGADHQRQRKAFLPFFSQSAVLAHASYVEGTVDALLDAATAVARRQDGAFDLRSDFAYQFPIRIVCRMLEIPATDVPNVQHWAEASVRAMDTEAGLTFAVSIAGQEASDHLRAYLGGLLTRARTGEFQGSVIRTVAHDDTLTEAERIANLGVIIFAGFETTTGLLSKGVDALLRHPAQWAALRDALVTGPPVTDLGVTVPDAQWRWLAWATTRPDREVDLVRRDHLQTMMARVPAAAARFDAIRDQEGLLDRAVEELLRWTAPGTVVPLTASKDIAVPLTAPQIIKGCPHAAGETLRLTQGDTIAVAVDEINRRCPVGAGRFDAGDPSTFDATRDENAHHLSFGLRHRCIGAFLAKENAKRALEGLLRRFPDLELAGDPIPQEMELFSGLASLPVRSRAVLDV